MQKKNRKGKMDVPDLADILEAIPTPSIWNTLPFQLPKWVVGFFYGIPSTIRTIKFILDERKRRKKQEEEEALAQEEEVEPEPVPRGPRRRRAGFIPQEKSGNNNIKEAFKKDNEQPNNIYEKPLISGGLWTDDDILELIKLVKKYPGGTPERWEKIADAMNRTVHEVTHMAKKVKEEGLKPGQPQDDSSTEEKKQKVKTRTELPAGNVEWSQEQQRALEAALIKYPKGASLDRWEKIACCVEGKTKDECQARYRQLVELLKKKNHS